MLSNMISSAENFTQSHVHSSHFHIGFSSTSFVLSHCLIGIKRTITGRDLRLSIVRTSPDVLSTELSQSSICLLNSGIPSCQTEALIFEQHQNIPQKRSIKLHSVESGETRLPQCLNLYIVDNKVDMLGSVRSSALQHL